MDALWPDIMPRELAYSLDEGGRVLHVMRGSKSALRAESKQGGVELPSSFVSGVADRS